MRALPIVLLTLAAAAASAQETTDKRATFELYGRAFGRTETNLPEWAANPSLEHLRLGADLRWRGVRAVVEGDWEDGVRLRDAFLRLRGRRLGVRLGQFKPPSSAVELESRWALPTADRGLTTRVLVDGAGLAGRRPGLEVEWRGGGGLDLNVRAGAFQASHTRGDLVGEGNFNSRDEGAPKVAARVAASPSGVGLGIFLESRPAEPIPGGPRERVWTAGADVSWQTRARRGTARLWADVLTGRSWLDHDPFDGRHASIASARVLGAWRLGGRKRGTRFVEAYARAGWIDADTSVREDAITEWAAGLNAGFWNRLRLTVENRHESFATHVPRALRPRGAAAARDSIVVQLGVQR